MASIVRDADYVPPKRSRYHADNTWTTTREQPCGRLRLVAYSPFQRVDWATDWQETKTGSLRTAIKAVVTAVEDAAVEFVAKLEAAYREAEFERRRWEAAEEKRRRETDQRAVEQSRRDSRDHLDQVIKGWANVISVERFISEVEKRIIELPEEGKAAILERLSLAREFLGTQDPLDFFFSWKTPRERYHRIYPEDEA